MYVKPPIGVAPAWFVYEKRIHELNECILRNIEHIEKYNSIENQRDRWEFISKMAVEIQLLSSLMKEIETMG